MSNVEQNQEACAQKLDSLEEHKREVEANNANKSKELLDN
jgi:hypothetical protein